MASLNKVMLIGRLGADPVKRYTATGTPVVSFRIATSSGRASREGQREERTEWHQIVAWEKLAEICDQYLSKGRLVYIEGRIQTREWEDKDGNRRWTTEIVASQMQMLTPPSGEQPRGADPGDLSPPPAEPGMDTDDDIPF
jgi:single-strand DNA-binding protein